MHKNNIINNKMIQVLLQCIKIMLIKYNTTTSNLIMIIERFFPFIKAGAARGSPFLYSILYTRRRIKLQKF